MSLISPLHSPATLCSAALGVLLLIYHPAFAGSFSLKAVLPALVFEMTYDGMDVADGTDAGLAWESGTGHKSGAAWLQERLGR